MQYGSLKIDWNPSYNDRVGFPFMNMGMMMMNRSFQKYLQGQSPKQFIQRTEFKMFVERFNSTYEHSLLKEQKELLGNFITSYSDNGLGLKVYLNNEIGRLKEAVDIEIVESANEALTENFKKVRAKLDNYAKTPLNEAVIEEIFYIQDLLAEVKRNVS